MDPTEGAEYLPSWGPVQKYATAIYSFKPDGEHQISLEVGDKLKIQEKSRDNNWYRGTVLSSDKRGIFPAAYVQLSGALSDETSDQSRRDPGIDRIDQVLKEWGAQLKTHYKEGNLTEFQSLKDRIINLVNSRRRIVSPQIAEVEKQKVLALTLDKIEEAKRLMGLDMIVRTPEGDPADEMNTGVNDLMDMHLELATKDLQGLIVQDTQEKKIFSPGARRKMRKRIGAGVASGAGEGMIPIQLHLDFKALICKVGEESEVFFSLYNAKEKRFITENFKVTLTAMGMASDASKIGKQWALFADLSEADLDGNLHLVCRVIRTGSLQYEVKKKEGKTKIASKGQVFRRPFAVGILKLSDEIFANKGGETVKLYKWKGSEETSFADLQSHLISGSMGAVEPIPMAKGIDVSMNRFAMPLSQFQKEYPEYEGIDIVNKLDFPEVIMPGDTRNSFYLTLEMADFPGETSSLNIEVIITARLDNGRLVQKAISSGVGETKTLFKSYVVYHATGPVWKETICFNIPVDVFEKTHLHFNLRHCDGKDKKDKGGFGYAFMRLCNADGTVIANGEHILQPYKNPKNVTDMVFYLSPSPENEKYVRKGQKLVVSTQLSSAVMTQNAPLLALLKWKENADDLADILKKVTFVDHIEIIKFMKEIFDAMFAILDTKANFAMLVYNALVFIIGILVDEKTSTFSNFRTVLDLYIDQHFSGRMAHKTLMTCLQFYLNKLDSPGHARLIRDSMKALEYIFKFIVASRILYNKHTYESEEDTHAFKQNLMECLAAFNSLMSQTSPALIGAQTIALKNFSCMLHDLSKIYDIADLANIACTFAVSIPYSETKKQLNHEKLNLILDLVRGTFYINSESRATIMPTVLNTLSLHMYKSKRELMLCVDILGVLLDTIQTKFEEADQPLATWELVPLLPQLMGAIDTVPEGNDRLNLVAVTLSFYYLMQPYMFDQYIDYLEDKEAFIVDTFLLCYKLLTGVSFPSNWFVMCMFQYMTILKVVKVLCPHLSSDHSKNTWSKFFQLMLEIIQSGGLQLELFPKAKQESIQQKYGDMRVESLSILKSLFEQHPKPELVGNLTIPTLEVLAKPVHDIQDMAIDLYLTLIRCEYDSTGAISAIASKTIDNLDNLVAAEGDVLNGIFLPRVQQLFNETEDSALKEQGAHFLKDLKKLQEHLNDLSTLPEDASYDDERVIATMKLMAYLKETGQTDSYVRYVHLLSNQHIASNNFTEAALTLLLHANLLEWNDDELEPQPSGPFPAEKMRERKEKLIRQAIDNFDKGKDWERAIEQIKELQSIYENQLFGYKELGNLLRKEASLYENIAETERFYPDYFRVGYYGKGFPPNISGKEFIYRGYELERIGDFKARIQGKFPKAELLTSTEVPPADIINGVGQYLLITPMNPSSPEERRGEKKAHVLNMPCTIRKYYKMNNTNVFVYAKTIKKDAAGAANEFACLWIQKTYLITADTFPTFHRSSEVVERYVTETAPIENAIEAVEQKNEDLEEFVEKYTLQKGISLNPFTMQLTGVIDAAVGGGMSNYQEAFLNDTFQRDNVALTTRLRGALDNQLDVLKRGLALHKELASEEIAGLQAHLDQKLQQLNLQLTGGSSKLAKMI